MPNSEENRLIQHIAPQIMRMVARALRNGIYVSTKSHAGDVVTTLDTHVDKLLSTRLQRAFPYPIISEESFNDGMLPAQGKYWIIDPICGTANLARGIKYFCTNIALIEHGHPIAAWVIDHSRDTVLWSVGGKRVYRGRTATSPPRVSLRYWSIDIDWGYWFHVPRTTKTCFANFTTALLLRRDTNVLSTVSSLSFAGVALGQFDAAVVINVYPWDIAAAAFLVAQNGGVTTNFDGTPWTLQSKSVVYASNRRVHAILLRLLAKHDLKTVV